MKIASLFCPSFSTISIPLGLVYVNTALTRAGFETDPYDFEMLLDLIDPDFNQELHHFVMYPVAQDDENRNVLFVNRLEILVESLYGEYSDPLISQLRHYAGKFSRYLTRKGYDTFLFSTYNSNLFFTLHMAKELKRLNPEATVVFGGPAISFPQVYEFVLATEYCDYCVIGEGEESVVELVRALSGSRQGESIPGVADRVSGKVRYVPRPKMDLSLLHRPDYAPFPFPGAKPQLYSAKTGYFALPISASRGCTLKCSFCAETRFWQNFRHRPAEAVIDEMADLSQRYGSRVFHVCDSLINADPAWLERFAAILEKQTPGFLINFAYSQARTLTPALIEQMVRGGFRWINFGVESGSDNLLKKMHKATNVSDILEILKCSLKAGLNLDFPIMKNVPGETREDVWNTVTFLSELEDFVAKENPSGSLVYSCDSNFRLEAMSGIFQNPKRYGIELQPFTPRLPEAARHLEKTVGAMCLRWSNSIPEEERKIRDSILSRFSKSIFKPKYSPSECREWVNLGYGYALQSDASLKTYPLERGSPLTIQTKVGEFQLPELLADIAKALPCRNPKNLAKRFKLSENAMKDALSELLAIYAIKTDASASLLGKSDLWKTMKDGASPPR